MPIILLGIIAIGGGLLLAYWLGGGGSSRSQNTGERINPMRPKQYEKSEDGKVVYLFKEKRAGNGGAQQEPGAVPSAEDVDSPQDAKGEADTDVNQDGEEGDDE